MMFRALLFVSLYASTSAVAYAEDYLVKNQNEYRTAEKNIQAGDTIILANGVWQDFEILLTAQGTSKKPISLRAEEAGKVILSGQSNLRISGKYLNVSGLVFRDGFTPTGEVISFRSSQDDLAFNSRITETVIDHFSKPDRYENDYWVGMYGQNNRFDHNHLEGKTNKGVTMAVRLNSEDSQDNYHRIDHNYFGPRPILGSNGGETLRIGTSKYSTVNSHTLVENNYFDRCDGEVEIISSKAGQNIFRGNIFYESIGTLTLRHGDGNLVENNIFMGNGKNHTGGIRVINRNQTVRNNYMEGLLGNGFASALTVMNGVPNSPANRYVQVENAVIENNSVISSARVTFNAGADAERSAPPIKSTFKNNVLSGAGDGEFVKIQDDISGISFDRNIISSGSLPQKVKGITAADLAMERTDNGLLYPTKSDAGAPRNLQPISRDAVGTTWYPKPDNIERFDSGKAIHVAPGEGTLSDAFANAQEGDMLVLSSGTYLLNKVLPLDRAITIIGPEDRSARIFFARPNLARIEEGGSIKLANLTIDGAAAPDSVGNAMIRTTIYPIQSNFKIAMDNVAITNFDVNRSFHVITLGKNSFADRVDIQNSSFDNVTGSILLAAAEIDDYGQYNVEYVDVKNSLFTNIGSTAFDIYRGGTDESTFGPHFYLSNSNFTNVGNKSRNKTPTAINLHGAQRTRIGNNLFKGSKPLRIVHTSGRPASLVEKNVFDDTAATIVEELVFKGDPRVIFRKNADTKTGETP